MLASLFQCVIYKSSTIAELAAQCCTNRSFAFEWVCIPLFDAFFSIICENIALNHALSKTEFFGIHSVADNGSDFNHFDVIGPKALEFGKITQLAASTSFKVIQGYRFRNQSKAVFIRLPMCE